MVFGAAFGKIPISPGVNDVHVAQPSPFHLEFEANGWASAEAMNRID